MKKKIDQVLLIDDDEATNFINELVIKKMNIVENIEVVNSAERALEYIKQVSKEFQKLPNLILLDVNMPRMNGWQFLEEYKTLKAQLKGQPLIIMLTTSINPDDRERALQITEVSGFRNKPLNEDLVKQIIEEFPQLTDNEI
ncbi:response regulator [Flexithrix dorotheae]|uniref:response regulator n=1 Tax=Flexithrix dorotheae TaxID=70993 RepID=UPI00036DA8DA|nr:response regulator [Flexithrix dorotheae]